MERECVRVGWCRRAAGGLQEGRKEEGDGEGWPEQETQGGKRGWVREVEVGDRVGGGGGNSGLGDRSRDTKTYVLWGRGECHLETNWRPCPLVGCGGKVVTLRREG